MPRRLTWLGVGLVAGAGASKWVERKVRQRVRRYLPAAGLLASLPGRVASLPGRVASLPGRVAGSARSAAARAGQGLKEAAQEARVGMVEKEAQLRAQLWGRPQGPGPAAEGGAHGAGAGGG